LLAHAVAAKSRPNTTLLPAPTAPHQIDPRVRTIIVDKRRRGAIPKRVWKWMKRRAAIEPTIGHLKAEHRLMRNRLKGTQSNAINALQRRRHEPCRSSSASFWAFFSAD
jgi:hypothetical protein